MLRALVLAMLALAMLACNAPTEPACIRIGDTLAVVSQWANGVETRHYVLAEKSTCPP